jgi:hypothetical protein
MNAICLPCREMEGKEAFRRAAESGLDVPPETGIRQTAPCARSRGHENTISRLSEPHVTPLMYSLSNVSRRGRPPVGETTKISRPQLCREAHG